MNVYNFILTRLFLFNHFDVISCHRPGDAALVIVYEEKRKDKLLIAFTIWKEKIKLTQKRNNNNFKWKC